MCRFGDLKKEDVHLLENFQIQATNMKQGFGDLTHYEKLRVINNDKQYDLGDSPQQGRCNQNL